MDSAKQYEATLRFGANTETDDLESAPQPVAGAAPPTEALLRSAIHKFVGDIDQLPPTYSAIKIKGRRACDLTRAGQVVQLKPRRVRVSQIVLRRYAWPDAEITIDCGRGTYIRSIARDLGALLQVGGYLTQLRRTQSGLFHIDQAVTIDQLRSDGIERHLIRSQDA